jgi:chlorite dismutase
MNEAFMYVMSIKFDTSWWSKSKDERASLISSLEETENKIRSNLISLKRFVSVRGNSDLLYWFSSADTDSLLNSRYSVLASLRGAASEGYSMISVFRPSPYEMGGGTDVSKILNLPQLQYFVAYPMKKSPEWYLLPFEERRKIMGEHINMAKSHPKNQGIRSYTTYSFGVQDDEFVVLYEIPSLSDWTHVVEKLREALARKWIVNEAPILVGETKDIKSAFLL